MMTQEMAEQVRAEVRRLKDEQDRFLQTYAKLCAHHGGDKWPGRADIEMVFHRVRQEIIPVMEQAGMDAHSIQALCSWAERLVLKQ